MTKTLALVALVSFFIVVPVSGFSSDADEEWHTVHRGRLNSLIFAFGGAGSVGLVNDTDRIEIGVEAIGIFALAESGQLAGGAGPYLRVRPIPRQFGKRFFLHVAAYGGYVTTGDWGFAPNAFVAYEPQSHTEEDLSEFFGIGLEGIIFVGVTF